MNHFTKFAAAAAVLSFSAGMASAVTLTDNVDFDPTDGPQIIGANQDVRSTGGVINAAGGSFKYDYQVSEDLFIRNFSLSVNGSNGGADINKLLGGFGDMSQVVELMAQPTNGGERVTFGGGILSGMAFTSGNTFSILFRVEDGQTLQSNVTPTVAFITESPVTDAAPVPVPAAGGLLLTALAAGGFAARRKKKAD